MAWQRAPREKQDRAGDPACSAPIRASFFLLLANLVAVGRWGGSCQPLRSVACPIRIAQTGKTETREPKGRGSARRDLRVGRRKTHSQTARETRRWTERGRKRKRHCQAEHKKPGPRLGSSKRRGSQSGNGDHSICNPTELGVTIVRV